MFRDVRARIDSFDKRCVRIYAKTLPFIKPRWRTFQFDSSVNEIALEKICLSSIVIARFEDNTFAYIRHPVDVDSEVDPKLITMVILTAEELDIVPFGGYIYAPYVPLMVFGPQGAVGQVGAAGPPRVGPQPPPTV